MGAADDLVGSVLRGQKTGTEWTVVEQLGQALGHTPGQFSVTYRCENQDGVSAFLKASDLSKVISSEPDDIMKKLFEATRAHDFERQILDRCTSNAMDRVVSAIDFGSKHVTNDGAIDVLFYLIFELAEGDLRKRVEGRNAFDLGWVASVLHDFAVGVRQLHSADIYHNDLKPANGLIFERTRGKIADLGRATTPTMSIAHDEYLCAGDCRFAAPEQLYSPGGVVSEFGRFGFYRGGDLYNLGSLAHYLLTGRSVTMTIISRLPNELRPKFASGGWTDHVEGVLPHWRARLVELLTESAGSIPEDWGDDLGVEYMNIIKMVEQLCEPDIRLRGHPLQIGRQGQFDLQRYISALDLQRKRISVRFVSAKG